MAGVYFWIRVYDYVYERDQYEKGTKLDEFYLKDMTNREEVKAHIRNMYSSNSSKDLKFAKPKKVQVESMQLSWSLPNFIMIIFIVSWILSASGVTNQFRGKLVNSLENILVMTTSTLQEMMSLMTILKQPFSAPTSVSVTS